MTIMRWALALACAIPLAVGAPEAATAAVVTLPQVKNAGGQNVPSTAAVLTWPDGSALGPDYPLPVAGASYTFAPAGGAAESGTAASYSFSAATQAAARGWYANCPAGAAVTVTLTTVNGGSAPRTLYEGWQDNDDRLAGWSGNAAGCTIGARF